MARPSFLGLVASGLLILAALVVAALGYEDISPSQSVVLLLLLAIAISAHSLQHSVEEVFFRFNPLRGQWLPSDDPATPLCPCARRNM